MSSYKVVEIFESINGEGMRAGELAVFVRLQSCNLNCSYCDTKWANEKDAPYTLMTKEEIFEKIRLSGIRNVTLTGGEPLLAENVDELISYLQGNEGIRVEIETNGSIALDKFAALDKRPVFTMDYKLPASGMEKFMKEENFAFLKKDDSVKFVSSDRNDLERGRELIEKYELTKRCHVLYSPVFGKIDPEEIVKFLKEYRMNDVRLQIQMHKVIWDPNARGV